MSCVKPYSWSSGNVKDYKYCLGEGSWLYWRKSLKENAEWAQRLWLSSSIGLPANFRFHSYQETSSFRSHFEIVESRQTLASSRWRWTHDYMCRNWELASGIISPASQIRCFPIRARGSTSCIICLLIAETNKPTVGFAVVLLLMGRSLKLHG
jgi:hypothetical protein